MVSLCYSTSSNLHLLHIYTFSASHCRMERDVIIICYGKQMNSSLALILSLIFVMFIAVGKQHNYYVSDS